MKKHRLASSPTSDALRTILLSSYEVTSKQHGLHDHSIFKSKRITTTGFVTRRLCPVVVEARLFFFGILVIISKIEVNGTKRWSRLCYFFTSSEISLSDLAHMISKQLKQSHGVTLVDVVIPTNASYIYMCVCVYIYRNTKEFCQHLSMLLYNLLSTHTRKTSPRLSHAK